MARLSRRFSVSRNAGFTLVELLVALAISGIILGGVATLAFAMGAANDASNDTSRKQARIRFATLRVLELVRYGRLVCAAGTNDFAIWKADDNNDGQININEVVYVDAGSQQDHLRLYECDSSSAVVTLSDIQAVGTAWWLGYYDIGSYTELISECSNVGFTFDAAPPQSRLVSITFDSVENEVGCQYEINAGLRSWAGNLLNEAGTDVVSDDD